MNALKQGSARLLVPLSLCLCGCIAPQAVESVFSPDGDLQAVILRRDSGALGETHAVALADRKGNQREVLRIDRQRFLRVEWRNEETLAIYCFYCEIRGGNSRSLTIDGRHISLEVNDFGSSRPARRRRLRLLPLSTGSPLDPSENGGLVFTKPGMKLLVGASALGDTLITLGVLSQADSLLVQSFSLESASGVRPIFLGLVEPGESVVEGQASPLKGRFSLKRSSKLILAWPPEDSESGIFPITVSMSVLDETSETVTLSFEIREKEQR